jgi:hypothetical protein
VRISTLISAEDAVSLIGPFRNPKSKTKNISIQIKVCRNRQLGTKLKSLL